ncbi:MAG: 30S ribosomal protein S3, partial [Euryarchaeota archaeon]|nr:30S ribosomal protein S3 [Euryarchaeota archaeon]
MTIERKFILDGIKKARIDEYFAKRLERTGYGGMKITRTPLGTQITISSEKPGMIIGKGGKIIKKLTEDLQTYFDFHNPQIDVQEIPKPELNAYLMATRLAHALERGWHFRKAGFLALQQVMDAGALGCEIIITGKVTGPRSRREKFVRGYMKHSGQPAAELVLAGVAAARRKEGALGVQVRILPPVELPDAIRILGIQVPGAPPPPA